MLTQKPDGDASVIATASSASDKLQFTFSSVCKRTSLPVKRNHLNFSGT